jgi:N-acetylmuramoyl-L-alanine amidase
MVGGVNDRLKPEDNFTQEQFYTLKKLLKDLTNKYKGVRIVGHRDLDNKKACPSFDVAKWLKGNDL